MQKEESERASSEAGSPAAHGVRAAERAVAWISKNFGVWLTLVSLTALRWPALFLWVHEESFFWLLSLLMFSVGVTTSIDDFRVSFRKRTAVFINFVACYAIMPVLAFTLALLIGASPSIMAGLVLIGSINGGHTSNLCTLIAGGDVALSVLMTMTTTLGCIVATPVIAKLFLGTVVPVDAVGIVTSTLQVVALPTFLGLGLNMAYPSTSKRAAKLTPVLGISATCVIVGASVASCQKSILEAGVALQLAVLTLHLLGGIFGYLVAKAANQTPTTCRTIAIETSMKSSAVGYLLAAMHFQSFLVRVPAAVSVVWSSVVGSMLAAFWSRNDKQVELSAGGR